MIWGAILGALLSKAKGGGEGGGLMQAPGADATMQTPAGGQSVGGGTSPQSTPAPSESPSGGGIGDSLMGMALNHAMSSNTSPMPAQDPGVPQIQPQMQQFPGMQSLGMFRNRRRF